MDPYYNQLLEHLEGYTVQGLFDGARKIEDIQTLQQGNRGRVFFFDQEPMDWQQDQELWDWLDTEPTILANSERNSIDKTYAFGTRKNLVDWNYCSSLLYADHWFGSFYRSSSLQWPFPIDFDKRKDFIVDSNLNIGKRQYRLYLMYHLQRLGVMDNSYYSFNADLDWYSDLEKYDHFGLLSHSDLLDELPSINVSYDDFGGVPVDKRGGLSTHINQEANDNSLVTFVMETEFMHNKLHFTEKVFKPIALGKPFILAAGSGSLEYLRQYGFETFSSVWYEGYDDITDPKARMDAIIELCVWFSKLSNREKQWAMDQADQIAMRNWHKFWWGYSKELAWDEALERLDKCKAMLLELSRPLHSDGHRRAFLSASTGSR